MGVVNQIFDFLIMERIKLFKQKLCNQFLNLPEIIDSLFSFMYKHHMISIKLDDIFNDEQENININLANLCIGLMMAVFGQIL